MDFGSPHETALVGQVSGRRYRLGDPIEVRVERVDRLRGRVDLAPAVEAHTGPKSVHRRVGALGPVQAFGLDALRGAAAQVGLGAEVVSTAG